MRVLALISMLTLMGCANIGTPDRPSNGMSAAPKLNFLDRLSVYMAARDFVTVIDRVEPVAERECRKRAKDLNCDFQIVIAGGRHSPPTPFKQLMSWAVR